MRYLTDGEREILQEQNRDAAETIEAEQVAEELRDLLECTIDGLALQMRTESYAEAGVLTHDAGFVIHAGGREFQVTLVRSR
jgi:molybdopterin biosynthesis enzyme MoaB